LRTIKQGYIDRIVNFLNGQASRVVNNQEFMQIYEIIVNQCDTEDNNEDLYQFFESECDNYINSYLVPTLRGKRGEHMVAAFVKCWNNFAIFSKCCHRMFDYLDRYFLKNHNLALLGENSLKRFREKVHDAHRRDILAAVLDQIRRDRDGEEVNLENLKTTLQAYVDMGLDKPKTQKIPSGIVWQGDKNLFVYESEFEAPLLEMTQVDYERKANLWNSQKNCPEYLMTVENSLAHEEARADYWLQSETKSKVMKKVEIELITKKAEAIVSKDTGCASMFQKKALQELALMFRIFKRDENTFKLIIAQMCPYIESRGTQLTSDETLLKDPIGFTVKLLELKAEMDLMIDESFQKQLPFQLGRDRSFQTFINNCSYSAMYLATYADHALKKEIKGKSED
jgi:cullin 1